MPRPRNIERKVRIGVWIPETLRGRIALRLWDPVMGTVPLGALSDLATRAITKELDSMETLNVQS